MMSPNGVSAQTTERRGAEVARWIARLLIALVLSSFIVLAFFSSGAVSR